MIRYFLASVVMSATVMLVPTRTVAANDVRICQAQEMNKDCSHCYGRDSAKQVRKCLDNCAAGTGGRKRKG